VELTNFLGATSGASSDDSRHIFIVRVEAAELPDVLITTGTSLTHRTPYALTIFAQAEVATCPGEQAPTGAHSALSYHWEIMRDKAAQGAGDGSSMWAARMLPLPWLGSTSVRTHAKGYENAGNYISLTMDSPTNDRSTHATSSLMRSR
jgi:hypothetical protein